MVLSESEAETQLAALRHQRETLDRAISDLTLYLELGRRLRSGAASAAETSRVSTASEPGSGPSGSLARSTEAEDRDSPRYPASFEHAPTAGQGSPSAIRQAPGSSSEGEGIRHESSRPSEPQPRGPSTDARDMAGSGPDPMDGALSEGVLARRYGRALIEAALAALEEAGRPLHAAEILAVLTSRGLSLPGHDPVAALNTRLWKRSGPGGPIKRMGDAVYALVEPEDQGRSDPGFR